MLFVSQSNGFSLLSWSHYHRYLWETPPRIDNYGPPVTIGKVIPRSYNRDPPYCLLSERNPVQKNLQHISVICIIAPPPPTQPMEVFTNRRVCKVLTLSYLGEIYTNSVLLRFSFMLQYAQQTYSCHK
jgi:hypothetical protein